MRTSMFWCGSSRILERRFSIHCSPQKVLWIKSWLCILLHVQSTRQQTMTGFYRSWLSDLHVKKFGRLTCTQSFSTQDYQQHVNNQYACIPWYVVWLFPSQSGRLLLWQPVFHHSDESRPVSCTWRSSPHQYGTLLWSLTPTLVINQRLRDRNCILFHIL